MNRHIPFDEVARELIADPGAAAAYLEEAAQDPDRRVFFLALKDVIAAQGGVSGLARKSGLNRANLQNVLTGKRRPQFETVARALDAAGFALAFRPKLRVPAPRRAVKRTQRATGA
jgi:probable addiction module antidote protein